MSALWLLSYVLLWALVAFQSLVLMGLVRTLYRLRAGGADLPGASSEANHRGEPAPAFTAADISGRWIDSLAFLGSPTMLLFISTTCTSCDITREEIIGLMRKASGNVLVVCGGEAGDCRSKTETYRQNVPVIADNGLSITKLFRISAVPTAVLIDEHWRIVSYGKPMADDELNADGRLIDDQVKVG